MTLLLDKCLEELDQAAGARGRHDYPQARCHYLRAAECLFRAAARSEGRTREVRTARAEDLLATARGLAGRARLTEGGEVVEGGAAEGSFLVCQTPEVHFDDVAGLDEAKEEIRLRLIYPLQHAAAAARYGVRTGGGLLLFGPPGTGKTLLARAVAGEVDAPFFTASPADLMSKWVGEAEQNVEGLFEQARACERAVIFIDEVEALIPARRDSTSAVMQRVVPQLLSELQGFSSRQGGLMFLAATNEPWAVDPAALRPGRFDSRVYVGLPGRVARRRLLDLYLARRPLAADVNLDRLAHELDGFSGADVADVCERCGARAFLESIREGTERDIAMQDVEAVVACSRPSVTQLDEDAYLRWAQGDRPRGEHAEARG